MPFCYADAFAAWRGFGESLQSVAILAVLSPAVMAVVGKASAGMLYAPLLIGAGGSLALWSMAISRLAE